MKRMLRSTDLCLEKREIGRRDNLKIRKFENLKIDLGVKRIFPQIPQIFADISLIFFSINHIANFCADLRDLREPKKYSLIENN